MHDRTRFEIHDTFQGRALPHWNRFAVGYAQVEERFGVVLLRAGPCGDRMLSDAELNDHRLSARGHWLWKPPVQMRVRARASHPVEAMRGTAGFGFWNAPFGEDSGAIDSPQAVWFFLAAPPSFMSLKAGGHGTGWRAQVLDVPRVPRLVLSAAGAAWYLLKPLRPLFTGAARTQVGGGEGTISAPIEDWHTYEIAWRADGVDFRVDDQNVFSTAASPRGPLGFCAWVDNSLLDVRAESFGTGHVALPREQWLELSELHIEPTNSG